MRMLPLLTILTVATPLMAAGQEASPPGADTTAEEVRALRDRVQKLENDVARLSARVPGGGQTGVTYGPVAPARKPLPQYATEADVLAERGVPTRVEWGPKGRTLIYGTERWNFDENGQVQSIQREH